MTNATIYLSEKRTVMESEKFRICSTLSSSGALKTASRSSGELYLLNDETLAGGQYLEAEIAISSDVLLLPIVGALNFRHHDIVARTILPGQAQLVHAVAGQKIQLSNPYQADLINYIMICFARPYSNLEGAASTAFFSLNENRNKLIEIDAVNTGEKGNRASSFYMGKFTGRCEAVYQKRELQNQLFLFVIEGAFEVQGRLLHARDGLSLPPDMQEIELEALSNDAIILLMEFASVTAPFTYESS